MKVKEYFSKRKEQGKIVDPAYDKFIEGLPDGEMPDEVFTVLENTFLTRDRAKTDPDIFGKAKAEIYNAVDLNLSTLYPMLPTEEAQRIGAEKDTHKKIDMIKAAFNTSLEKAKKHDPNSAKDIEDLKKSNTDLIEKLNKSQEEIQAKDSQWEQKHASELKKAKLQYDILGKISTIELAKEFSDDPKRKEQVTKLILSEIQGQNPNYDANGHLAVFDDTEGKTPKFSGNSVITFEKVLEDAAKPFIKRNNAEGNGQEKKRAERTPAPEGKPTLRQLQQQAAGV
jgi:hypothetical protein